MITKKIRTYFIIGFAEIKVRVIALAPQGPGQHLYHCQNLCNDLGVPIHYEILVNRLNSRFTLQVKNGNLRF